MYQINALQINILYSKKLLYLYCYGRHPRPIGGAAKAGGQACGPETRNSSMSVCSGHMIFVFEDNGHLSLLVLAISGSSTPRVL